MPLYAFISIKSIRFLMTVVSIIFNLHNGGYVKFGKGANFCLFLNYIKPFYGLQIVKLFFTGLDSLALSPLNINFKRSTLLSGNIVEILIALKVIIFTLTANAILLAPSP